MLGTTPRTLRQWDATGELVQARKTTGGTRYYAVADLLAVGDENAPTIGCRPSIAAAFRLGRYAMSDPRTKRRMIVRITRSSHQPIVKR